MIKFLNFVPSVSLNNIKKKAYFAMKAHSLKVLYYEPDPKTSGIAKIRKTAWRASVMKFLEII